MRILIICTGNTCRSQMAEGFLKSFDPQLEVFSAGTIAESTVNQYAVKVMKELGLDIGKQKPEPIEKYLDQSYDYVITVCDGAKDICPVFTGDVKNKVHIGFEDPAKAKGTEDQIIIVYRKIRNQINAEFYDFYKKIMNLN